MYCSTVKATTGILLSILTIFLASCAGKALQQAALETHDYVIAPGDILEIQVWKEPDLTRLARVRIDGKISIPLVDDIQAAGLTPLALKQAIEERLQGFVEVPKVTIIVSESSHRIYITGKVGSPGQFPLNKNLTALEAITLAGGPTQWADSNDILIMRQVGGETKRIPFQYKKVISGKQLEQNIYLQPNDIIIVP